VEAHATITSGWSRLASARSARPSPSEPTTKHSLASAAALSASIGRIIISQRHTRALHGARVGEGGTGGHGAI
jgi:ribosomal protein L27